MFDAAFRFICQCTSKVAPISVKLMLVLLFFSFLTPMEVRANINLQNQLDELMSQLKTLQQAVSALSNRAVLGARTDNVSGLVARYDLDSLSVTDDLGSANGTLVGNPTVVTGKEGSGALSFDGTSGILLGNPNSLQLTNAISFSAWVRTSGQQSSGWGRIISRNNGSTAERWGATISTNRQLDCRINSATARSANNSIKDNTWHHVACTYDGTTLRAYLDGVLVGSASVSTTLSTDNQVSIGYNVNGGETRYFKGALDDVRVYNRVLTTDDVSAIMATSASQPTPTPTPTPTPMRPNRTLRHESRFPTPE